MITQEQREKLRGWFTGRLPDDLFEALVEVTVDREEITVIGRIPGPRLAEGVSAAERDAAVRGRIQEFRERTREERVEVAREAEHTFGRKVSWGVECDGERALFTHAEECGGHRNRVGLDLGVPQQAAGESGKGLE